ncbi:DegT/DnrJ/EryC1/StrS family aminotransferase [Zhongshania aliphaticivorans]|uniref:Aminotransferase n=1 Tax=Zhongshania aliphaticivorans TaxID=1470434 RepID=A0A127M1W7_9GAMM|nr:DegT/DnrJ/EryC1/StrS family aminotransferase [Zhongshania aliphaticivorans]AMO67226.1 aminotransferase [Zhongshania aliphaticivorans]
MPDKPIFVTQPFLPPLDEYVPYLEEIWDSKILTNGGQMHQRFERALCEHLGVEHISLFNNGTIALLAALQELRVTGEVITTPYSFVATSHSLLWKGAKPVFVDIDPVSLNLDPQKIEAAITPQTTAIMPVHCYGNPCDTDAIKAIADLYNLKVIYDSAHAFGVEDRAGSILNHGDLSVLSFHATKVFTTFEGGAVICPDAKSKRRLDYIKNFGFQNEVSVVAPGINGKLSEVNAAMGLLQLKYFDQIIKRRKDIDAYYRRGLAGVSGIAIPSRERQVVDNYAYFPILIESDFGMSRDELYELMLSDDIYTRRYFYPLISEFPMYRGLPSASSNNLPVASSVSRKILCLPIYPALENADVQRVVDVIRKV